MRGAGLRRSLGINGTRLTAVRGDEMVGYIEVETLEDAGRLPRHGGWADIGNLEVVEHSPTSRLATWLIGQAADWLRLARVERLLAYAWPERGGLHRLARVRRLSGAHAHAAGLGQAGLDRVAGCRSRCTATPSTTSATPAISTQVGS